MNKSGAVFNFNKKENKDLMDFSLKLRANCVVVCLFVRMSVDVI